MAAWIDMRNYLRNYRRNSLLLAPLGLSLLGCGGDTAGPATRSTLVNDYWALRLNQHVITLAVAPPHNTIQLNALPMSAEGKAFPSASSVNYTILSRDTSIVVSSPGVVTARAPSYQTPGDFYAYQYPLIPVAAVIASLTIDGVTLADTALVQVTATAPTAPLQRISIQPPAESLALYQSGHWLVVGHPLPLNVKQFDVNGDTVSNGLINVRSSDLNSGYGGADGCSATPPCVRGVKAQAAVTFYVQLWYYGVDVSDSLRVRIGYPHSGTLNAYETTPIESRDIKLYWWPTTVNVTAPAEVTFTNSSRTIPLDATFDHPEHVHVDTIGDGEFFRNNHFKLPLSAEGNVTPFYADTVGAGTACAEAKFDGTTISADSTCKWTGNGWDASRSRTFTTPGTYEYHTRFGIGGKIIVH